MSDGEYPKMPLNPNDPPPQYHNMGQQAMYVPPSAQPMMTGGMPPPPPMMGVAQPQVIYVVPSQLSDRPQQMVCPNCRANIVTNTEFETGMATWLIVGGLCFFGLGLGCCLIPFCIDGCKDVVHTCPNCQALIGRYKRI